MAEIATNNWIRANRTSTWVNPSSQTNTQCPRRTDIVAVAGFSVGNQTGIGGAYGTNQCVQQPDITYVAPVVGSATLQASGSNLTAPVTINGGYIAIGTSSGSVGSVSFQSVTVPATGASQSTSQSFNQSQTGTLAGGSAGAGSVSGLGSASITTMIRIAEGPTTLVITTPPVAGSSLSIPNNGASFTGALNVQLTFMITGTSTPSSNLTLTISGGGGSMNANGINTNLGQFSVNGGGTASQSYSITSPITWFQVMGGNYTSEISLYCSNGGVINQFVYSTGTTYNSSNKPSTWWNHTIGTHSLSISFY